MNGEMVDGETTGEDGLQKGEEQARRLLRSPLEKNNDNDRSSIAAFAQAMSSPNETARKQLASTTFSLPTDVDIEGLCLSPVGSMVQSEDEGASNGGGGGVSSTPRARMKLGGNNDRYTAARAALFGEIISHRFGNKQQQHRSASMSETDNGSDRYSRKHSKGLRLFKDVLSPVTPQQDVQLTPPDTTAATGIQSSSESSATMEPMKKAETVPPSSSSITTTTRKEGGDRTTTTATYYPNRHNTPATAATITTSSVPKSTKGISSSSESAKTTITPISPPSRTSTVISDSTLSVEPDYESEREDSTEKQQQQEQDWIVGLSGNSPGRVSLMPFNHRVGGHTAMFRFSRRAICKV